MTRKFGRLFYAAFVAVQLLFFLVAAERPAYGYVDPGSGILVVQFVSSIIGGGMYLLRKRLKQLFHLEKHPETSAPKSGSES